MKTDFENAIKNIESNFDFEKIHQVMTYLHWGWHCVDDLGNTNIVIPDVVRIKNHAFELLKDAYEHKTIVGSGGFEARWVEGDLELKFILEEC